VIRISITSTAFDAIKATLPAGSAAYEPQDCSGRLFHLGRARLAQQVFDGFFEALGDVTPQGEC